MRIGSDQIAIGVLPHPALYLELKGAPAVIFLPPQAPLDLAAKLTSAAQQAIDRKSTAVN
jgi:hypothetical protein